VEEILALMIPIVFILAMASVLILRPITKRLGDALHQMQQDRHEARLDQGQLDQIRALVESVQERVELVEQRQSFFESLLESRTQRVRLEEGVDRSAGSALK
jgi:hypothetical protein